MNLPAAIATVLSQIEQDAQVADIEWTGNRLRRLAVGMQWIQVGELARRHCDRAGIPQGTPPWSGLIGFRAVLAHSTEDEIDCDLVHRFSTGDVVTYRREVEAHADVES